MNKLIKQIFCKHCYWLVKIKPLGYIGKPPEFEPYSKHIYKCIKCGKKIELEIFEARYTRKNLSKWGDIE